MWVSVDVGSSRCASSMEDNALVLFAGIPGAELATIGLSDLSSGLETPAACLVSIGAPRLRQLGVTVHNPLPEPEHRLYALLAATGSDNAHARYNGLVRRLVSFERALARLR